MNECKHCKKELAHTEGRRKKEFCNDTCRSNYWYAKNVKSKSKKEVKPTIQFTKSTPESFDGSNTKPLILDEVGAMGNLEFDREDAQRRLNDLRTEIKAPPKNPIIGLRKWLAVRQAEIKVLEGLLKQE